MDETDSCAKALEIPFRLSDKDKMRTILACIGILLLASCAATSKLDTYAERAIDRSEALAEGVTLYRFTYSQSFSAPANLGVLPFYWEQGISEHWTLVFMPLPLQVRYRLAHDEESWWTVDAAFLGPMLTRTRNLDWRPTLYSHYRRKLSAEFALELGGLALAEVKRTGANKLGTTFGLKAGAGWQLHPRFYLQAGLWVQREHGAARAQYVGEIPPDADSDAVRWRYPLQFQLTWSLHRQWDFSARIDVYRLGYPAVYSSNSFYAWVTHAW